MSFAAVAAAAVGAGTSIYLSEKQKKDARKIREQSKDPGIQRNYGLERTNQILADNYNNFNLPGFTRYREQIASNQATGMSSLLQGASSSEDILAGATALQEQSNRAIGNMYTTQAQGKLDALSAYLGSVNAVGQDQVRVNQMDLSRYEQTMREAAALEGASMQNLNTGIQDMLMGIQPLITSLQPETYINPNTGKREKGQSRWNLMFKGQ